MAERLLSPELVAREIGVPEVFVLAWLAGTNAPGLAPCCQLARLFGEPPARVWALANDVIQRLGADS